MTHGAFKKIDITSRTIKFVDVTLEGFRWKCGVISEKAALDPAVREEKQRVSK